MAGIQTHKETIPHHGKTVRRAQQKATPQLCMHDKFDTFIVYATVVI